MIPENDFGGPEEAERLRRIHTPRPDPRPFPQVSNVMLATDKECEECGLFDNYHHASCSHFDSGYSDPET